MTAHDRLELIRRRHAAGMWMTFEDAGFLFSAIAALRTIAVREVRDALYGYGEGDLNECSRQAKQSVGYQFEDLMEALSPQGDPA